MRSFILLLFIFFITACGQHKIPDDIIKVNDMKFIMWDLTRAGQYNELKNLKDTSSKIKPSATLLYEQVFSLHKVKKDDFYKSLKFYQSHPDINKVLMDSLAAYATRERTKLYQKRQ